MLVPQVESGQVASPQRTPCAAWVSLPAGAKCDEQWLVIPAVESCSFASFEESWIPAFAGLTS